jgi:hypothetical protein
MGDTWGSFSPTRWVKGWRRRKGCRREARSEGSVEHAKPNAGDTSLSVSAQAALHSAGRPTGFALFNAIDRPLSNARMKTNEAPPQTDEVYRLAQVV